MAQFRLVGLIRRNSLSILTHVWSLIGVSVAHHRFTNPYLKSSQARALSGCTTAHRRAKLQPSTSAFKISPESPGGMDEQDIRNAPSSLLRPEKDLPIWNLNFSPVLKIEHDKFQTLPKCHPDLRPSGQRKCPPFEKVALRCRIRRRTVSSAGCPICQDAPGFGLRGPP